ncbi:MAG: hypothetical protein J0L62_11635 [Bacteroidetes bacterium]|nr:hypothetical protein [Bacteroidota bacterium]
MTKEIHFKEDTAKPENRVNISLFHLLMVKEIRDFVFSKLNIPTDCVIYPSPNLTTEEFDAVGRPDFVIKKGTEKWGYIEVELGHEDEKQLRNYRTGQPLPVYSIIGKRGFGSCDLSLEEIFHHLEKVGSDFEGTQTSQSIKLLTSLLDYYVIQGKGNNQKSVSLSDKMKKSRLVSHFYTFFGETRILENTSVKRNKIMFNTMGENGFSLRIFSPETGSNGLSLMNRTGGSLDVYFPSQIKLQKYLPDRKKEVDDYVALIAELGAREIYRKKENEKCRLSLTTVEENANRFCEVIGRLISI